MIQTLISIAFSTATSAGDTFRGFAPNVVCHRQDDLVPGVSSAAVAAHLARRFGVVAGVNAYNATLGRDVVGWYTQQFVKLGAVTSPRLRSLSRWFLIWDLGTLPSTSLALCTRPCASFILLCLK